MGVSFAEGTQFIKVGLMYGSVKETSLPLSSPEGLSFGEYKNQVWNPYLNFGNSTALTVIKNGSNSSDAIITIPGQTGSVTYGKYHCQIGGEFDSVFLANAELAKIKAIDSNAYLAYDGLWKIYIGSYLNEGEMTIKLSELQSKFIPLNIQRATFNYNAFMVLENNVVTLLFDGSKGDLGFKSQVEGGIVSFNKYKYRNALLFKRYTSSDPTVINYLPLDHYVYGVIPYEISPNWHVEALKAQAVAARNYAVISLNKHSKHGFDVCTTEDCQVYAGYNVEKPSSNSAVDLTSNKFLKYNGKLAQTYFHSNSGGRTENSENVWNAAFPYLIGVDDPYSVGAPNSEWTVRYTSSEIEQLLLAKKYNIGSLKSVYVEKVSQNGRALKTTFVGTASTISFDKDKIRSIFKTGDLKSTWFTISSGNTPPTGNTVPNMNTAPTGNTVISGNVVPSGNVNPAGNASIIVESASGLATLNTEGVYVASAQNTALNPVGNALVGHNGVTNLPLTVTPFVPPSTTTILPMPPTTTPATIPTNGVFVINGRGNGHGIGMSQWGIKKMAETGFSYEQILSFYYPGTYIE